MNARTAPEANDLTRLTREQRTAALEEMSGPEGLDVLVVGGGITGAGIALDAASRGLRTGVVEMGDWASGTSTWSSKLVHGGLRYLYQLDFALVREALSERGRLLQTTAPHLVKAQPFLWPLKHHYERSYSAVGVGMYDALALAGSRGRKTVPIQRHLGRKGTSALAPSLDTSGLAGSIRFFDARVDDARLVIDLVRTAVGLGALAANRTRVTGFLKDDEGRVTGVAATDLASGKEIEIRAAAALKRRIKSARLPKSRAAHKQGKMLEEEALRRIAQMLLHPESRILSLRRHALRVQILPRERGSIRKRTHGSNLRVQQEGLRHFLQAVLREHNALLQEQQQFSGRGVCAAVVPCNEALPAAGKKTARHIMQLLPCRALLCLRRNNDQLCIHAASGGGGERRLRRLAQVRSLRCREDDAERAHDFNARSRRKSVLRIFAASAIAFS